MKSDGGSGKEKRTTGWRVFAALAAGVGAVVFAPAGIAWFFTHPPRRLHRRTPQSALGLHFHRVRLTTMDNVRLSAWYVPVAERARGVVVVCHGYYGNRAEMLPYLRFLHEAGYAAVLLDFRAHGWSGGKMATFGASETGDARAALDWAERQPELAGLPLALLGESMGGAVALLVAAGDARVRAVVADSAFARFDNAVAGRVRLMVGARLAPRLAPPVRAAGARFFGIQAQAIAPEDVIARLGPHCPILLIHGTADRLIAPENAHRLLAAARDNATLWEVEGAGHVQSVRVAPDEYARRVTSFLAGALGNREDGK